MFSKKKKLVETLDKVINDAGHKLSTEEIEQLLSVRKGLQNATTAEEIMKWLLLLGKFFTIFKDFF